MRQPGSLLRTALILTLAVSLLPRPLPADPSKAGPEELRSLIAGLDDDDAGKRDAASKALTEAPEAATPLLEAAAKDGSPEARYRAVQILHDRKVLAVLRRPANAKLMEKIDDVLGRDLPLRRAAIKGWVDGLARVPATIDALIEMNAVDPNAAGGAALEALNWLCAPKATASVSRWEVSSSNAPRPAMTHLEELFSMSSVAIRASENAKPLLDQSRIGRDTFGMGHPLLDELRDVCLQAGVAYRFDDENPGVVLETPAETISYWNSWWATARKDELALMDLGLVKRPDGSKLKKEDVAKWVDALASKDERHARVARGVLKDMPDALVAEIGKRAGKERDAISDMRDRLALGKLGRLVFARWHDGKGALLAANPDGSDEIVISGDVGSVRFPSASSDGTRVFATGSDAAGKSALWCFDPSGRAAPKRLAEMSSMATASPNGLWAATQLPTQEMSLVNLGSGEALTVGPAAAWAPFWSRDGRRVAWICRKAKCVMIFDTKDKKPCEIADSLPWPQGLAWRPDGGSLAMTRQTHADGQAWAQWSMTVEIADPATGKLKALGGPYKQVQGLTWSPDGGRLACLAAEGDDALKATRQIVIFDVASGKSSTLPDPSTEPLSQAWMSWSPDGKSLLFCANGLPPKTWVVDAAQGTATAIPGASISAAWAPGLDGILDADDDIRLHRRDGSGALKIVESPDGDSFPVFIRAKR